MVLTLNHGVLQLMVLQHAKLLLKPQVKVTTWKLVYESFRTSVSHSTTIYTKHLLASKQYIGHFLSKYISHKSYTVRRTIPTWHRASATRGLQIIQNKYTKLKVGLPYGDFEHQATRGPTKYIVTLHSIQHRHRNKTQYHLKGSYKNSKSFKYCLQFHTAFP